jgi:hypothetical protein
LRLIPQSQPKTLETRGRAAPEEARKSFCNEKLAPKHVGTHLLSGYDAKYAKSQMQRYKVFSEALKVSQGCLKSIIGTAWPRKDCLYR